MHGPCNLCYVPLKAEQIPWISSGLLVGLWESCQTKLCHYSELALSPAVPGRGGTKITSCRLANKQKTQPAPYPWKGADSMYPHYQHVTLSDISCQLPSLSQRFFNSCVHQTLGAPGELHLPQAATCGHSRSGLGSSGNEQGGGSRHQPLRRVGFLVERDPENARVALIISCFTSGGLKHCQDPAKRGPNVSIASDCGLIVLLMSSRRSSPRREQNAGDRNCTTGEKDMGLSSGKRLVYVSMQ